MVCRAEAVAKRLAPSCWGAAHAPHFPVSNNMNDQPSEGGRVAFPASADFTHALDRAAGASGENPSHYARRILAAHLRDAGLLAPDAPTTYQDAMRRHRGRRRSTGAAA